MTQALLEKKQIRSFTSEEAMAFSRRGDQLFNELAGRMATSHDYRLLFQGKYSKASMHRLDPIFKFF